MESIEKRLLSIEVCLAIIEQNQVVIQQNEMVMRNDMNKRERHSRQFNLRIIGIPENEEPTKVTVTLAQTVGLSNFLKQDIEISNRLGAKNKGENRVVIARFHPRVKRCALLVKRKDIKQATNIVVYEDLTRIDKQILDEIRRRLDVTDKKYALTRNGRVMYKYEENKAAFINTFEDIDYYGL
ncbi:unnamed protein product [Didymodactylos carnosus]|nr:unnamed protein product [Didymodactylos carnosus]CAF4057121.1 unnamed protein product [Didymodactylos carnosus]